MVVAGWGALSPSAHREGKQVETVPLHKDRYQRTVARIKCSGVDVNIEQLKHGMARVYPFKRKIAFSTCIPISPA